ncbi:hypothetical protein K492DRAFT_237159 [Lichtheimia hyalospora FSU 10163]|nr:hypothetical protein K492DRAFT_237159 [Lichtheimia hyalospora FSU 10163]
MSTLLDDDDPSSNDLPAPLQPPPPQQQQQQLPRHILRRILKLLSVPSLAHVALASRDFKSLVYEDAIWNSKLHDILKNDSSNLSDMLEHGDTFSSDTHDVMGKQGVARLQFKQLYQYLMPYYIDLRHKHRESRVLLEYGQEPVKCGVLLSRLVSFSRCHAVDDWKEINESLNAVCQYFETASLQEFEIAYDVTSTTEMKTFADALIALSPVSSTLCQQTFIQKHVIFSNDQDAKPEDNFKTSRNDLEPFKQFIANVKNAFMEQSHVIVQVFPKEMDMFYLFVDRALEDVVSEYVSSLLATAHERDQLLYLNTMSTVLTSVRDTINALTGDDLPINIDQERGINLLYKLFIPFLDDYLSEEQQCVKTRSQELIDEWNLSSGVRRDDPTSRLSNQSRETFKRNYLMAFKKVVTLPVDLVSSAATTIASPILSTLRSSEDTTLKSPSTLGSPLSEESSQITPPRTPEVTPITVSSPPPPKNKSLLLSRQSSHQSLRSQDTTRSVDLKSAMHELDMMQDFLSLDTVLQLIHLNKDAERRVEQLLNIGFPGRMQNEIQKAYEQIFVQLARFLGNQHIKPAFDRAIEHLDSYTPDMDSLEQSPGNVPPLTEFFEMVHIGDVIQQMVQLYYDERISKHVDKFDFLNDVNKEKKVFERILDDCVACGMDQSIQVLLAQVEYILVHEQKPEDYNPRGDVLTDLKPTKACRDTIECLRSNTSILRGAAEKSTMDLFFNEIGRRFADDMNAYNDFAISLRQKSVTPYFSALKALANIYIISSAPDIKNMIHDMERYHGLLKVEDLVEFAACRSDWPAIKRVVMRDMTDCSIM